MRVKLTCIARTQESALVSGPSFLEMSRIKRTVHKQKWFDCNIGRRLSLLGSDRKETRG